MDATISVICFKSKTLANGEHPLMLRITKDRKRTMKSLGVSVHPSNWDFDRNEPKPKCPDRKYIQQIILKVKSEYQTKLLEKAARDEDYTAETLVKEQTREQIQSETVENFYLRTVEQLKREGAVGNVYAYLNSYNVLKSFNRDKPLHFTFSRIDANYLEKFEEWMRTRGNKDMSMSFQMRTLRAVFNLAKPSGIFPAGKYPMYFPDAIERIGFNILPCGKYTGDKFGNFGTYSFHWTATVTSDNKNYRITIGNNSCNFSTYAETGSSNNVRCVANY